MNRFIDLYEENIKAFPDRVALVTDYNNESITYGELDSISAKIYNYLNQKEIGKEEFVLICLPRGPRIVAAIIGVIKSGAAFTVVEDTYPADRIEFIKKDCDAVLTLDTSLYSTIVSEYEEKASHEETDRHDACFAVYTSGTTGNPKGVLHEYGKIEMCVNMKRDVNAEAKGNALGSPLNFVASIMSVLIRMTVGDTLYILSYDTAKNLDKYMAFLEEHNIENAFITPSMLRIMKRIPSCLKVIGVGGEPANGIYVPGVIVVNSYSASEAGFVVANFVIDKKYDTTPVGKSPLGIEIMLLDDDGNKVPDGQTGEVCFQNDYTRGYINLPEQTKKVFVNGIFHTGDSGYKDENGNLVITGRIDDMIKINGNRVEPSEIENVVKQVFNVENVVAKGFSSKSRAYIALYYLKSEGADIFGDMEVTQINERISNRLPAYMLPTYYVPLDEMPINPNGKISRKLLKEPVIIQEADYVEPSTALEKRICDSMAKTLSLEKVSVDADFFSCGGDSILAITFVTECSDMGISGSDLYRLRTPRKLADYIESNVVGDSLKELDREAKTAVFPLLYGQKIHIEDQNGNLINKLSLPLLWRLNDTVDIDKFKRVVEKVILSHPAFSTRMMYLEDGSIGQCYDKSLFSPIEVCNTTEDEIHRIVATLIGKYSCIGECLYRNKIFITDEGSYFFIDVSHLIADGTGYNLFIKDICNLYVDESYEIKPDYYFGILKRVFDSKEKQEYQEAINYYKKIYHNKERDKFFDYDHENNKSDADVINSKLDIQKSKDHGNVFFTTAMALAVAHHNNDKEALIYWVHNGRDDVNENNSVGQLARAIPMCLSILDSDTPESLIKKTVEQVEKGIQYKSFDFFDEYGIDINRVMRFMYQKDIYANKSKQNANNPIIAETYNMSQYVTDNLGLCSAVVIDNSGESELMFGFKYAKHSIDKESANRFLKEMNNAVVYLTKKED